MSRKESKNIKFLLKKIDSQSIITVFVALALVVYSLTIKQDYGEIATRNIKGILESKPYIKETGGDFTYYHLVISLNGTEGEFVVRDCAFEALEKEHIDLLEKGQEITLTIKADKKKESHSYKVLGIVYKNIELIDVEHSISCHDNSWIKNTILLLIALVIIGISLIRVYRK
ncbi:MAG: hypothetical protein ABJN36_12460 [Cyclobacteriaceae bacterium]